MPNEVICRGHIDDLFNDTNRPYRSQSAPSSMVVRSRLTQSWWDRLLSLVAAVITILMSVAIVSFFSR
jgi:hypothetical protein